MNRKEIWPKEQAPSKEEIERMYRMAYCVDPEFFRREDVADFGLDLRRLKEFGEVLMAKKLPVLRSGSTGSSGEVRISIDVEATDRLRTTPFQRVP